MPIHVTCDGCGAAYVLKDEYAGKKLRCKSCQTVLEAPALLDTFDQVVDETDGTLDPAFRRDRFLMKQKRISISEKYYVYDEMQNPILFIERPAHLLKAIGASLVLIAVLIVGIVASLGIGLAVGERGGGQVVGGVIFVVGLLVSIALGITLVIWIYPKRHIRIFADDTRQRLLLEVLQDKKVSIIKATYTVVDPVDGPLGQFHKNYLYNFFRKRWYGFRPDGTLFVLAKEDSLILSLLRRLLGSIEILGMFLRTNFVFHLPGSEEVIGEFNRKFTLFDQYVLDLSADRQRALDRRLAVALGVLLDTGEHR